MSEVVTVVPLGQNIEVLSGFAFPSSGFNQLVGLPLIRIRDLSSAETEVRFSGRYDPAYLIKEGDLLIGMDGDFEVHRWTGDTALLNQRVCKVEAATRQVDQGFLYWYLQPRVAEIHRRTPQTTVRHLSASDLYLIPTPPICPAEQGAVARILDTLDIAIHETEAVISKLKVVKQGLLHDLLTRGIDANGELRPPQAEAPHSYKESPLGWIPQEWALKTIDQILSEPTRNGLYKPSQLHGRGPLMVQMGGLFAGEAATFDTASRVQVSPFELNSFGLATGDLLFARRSLVFEGAGQCVVVRDLPEPATFESSIVRVRVKRNEAHPEFVGQFLRGHASGKQRRTMIRQVAVSGVSGQDIRGLFVPLPSLAEQTLALTRLEAIQHRIDSEHASLVKMRRQRVGLMDDLLTGRVRVTPLLTAEQRGGA